MRTSECVMRFSAYQGWWWLQLELVIPTITRSHSNLYPNQLALWPNPELIPNPNSNHNLRSLVRVEYELSWVWRVNDYSLHARHLWSVYWLLKHRWRQAPQRQRLQATTASQLEALYSPLSPTTPTPQCVMQACRYKVAVLSSTTLQLDWTRDGGTVGQWLCWLSVSGRCTSAHRLSSHVSLSASSSSLLLSFHQVSSLFSDKTVTEQANTVPPSPIYDLKCPSPQIVTMLGKAYNHGQGTQTWHCFVSPPQSIYNLTSNFALNYWPSSLVTAIVQC